MLFFLNTSIVLSVLSIYIGWDTLWAQPGRDVFVGFEKLFLFSLSALLVSWFTCFIIKRMDYFHRHLTYDDVLSGVQKLHKVPVPRIGGVAVMAAFLFCFLLMLVLPYQEGFARSYLGLILLVALPIFIAVLSKILQS